MPAVLNVKAEEINSDEKRSKYIVSVVGCGQKGIFFAVAFANAGFKVVCSDADASIIKRVAKGKTFNTGQETEGSLKSLITSGQLTVTSELKKAVAKSDIIIITVPARVDDKKKIDCLEALNACKQVGTALQSGTLVIYGDVASFGFTEGAAKDTLENTSGLKAGVDFGLAYSPICNLEINPKLQANFELKVAGVGKPSLDTATNILRTITKNVKPINDIKTAEIATLFKVAKQDANTALANELAVFCESANIDYFEVLKLLGLNDKTLWPTTVAEENKNEAYLLLESADNINAKLRLPTLSRQINEEMLKHAVNLTQDALRSCGKTLRRARIAVLGSVSPSTSTVVFVKMLELKGAKVSLFDPASKKEPLDLAIIKSSLNEAVEGTDCIVILTGEEYFTHLNLKKLKPLTKAPSVIVDLAGAFEQEKVEAEGFKYRGLGRGTG
jgi:UDP-N-acetyl-D-mannosaminuronic acid dehydrogenase